MASSHPPETLWRVTSSRFLEVAKLRWRTRRCDPGTAWHASELRNLRKRGHRPLSWGIGGVGEVIPANAPPETSCESVASIRTALWRLLWERQLQNELLPALAERVHVFFAHDGL